MYTFHSSIRIGTLVKGALLLLSVQALNVLAGSPETLTIAGTGASQSLLRDVAVAFNRTGNGCRANVPNSVGSRGGIRLLLAGRADLARVSRPLKDREKAKGLLYKAFAETQVVFVTHPSVEGVEMLTVAEVLDIYAGRIDNWKQVGGPDQPIYPLTRDGGTTLKTVRRHVPGFELLSPAAKPTYSSLETKQLLLKHPYTIGYLPMTLMVDTPLRSIGVEGVSSGRPLVASPSMPLRLGIAYREPLAPCAKKFLGFLNTDEAHAIMRTHLSLPVGD